MEFTLIFKNTSIHEALVITEKVRDHIGNNFIRHENENLRITISIGVTEYTIKDNRRSIVKRTDNALLTAKKYGRNRVGFL